MKVLSLFWIALIAIPALEKNGAHALQRDCAAPSSSAKLPSPLPQLAGDWTLTLHRSRSAHARLALRLKAADSVEQTSRSVIDGRTRRDAGYVYLGTLQGDGRAIGLGLVDEESLDPDRPGVRVTRSKHDVEELQISVGAEQNNRNVIRFDGYTFYLQVRSATDTLLGGTWEAGVYVIGQVDSGWWCARRAK